VRFSFHLPAPRPSASIGIDDLLSVARIAESLGVDAICASDHPFPVVERGKPGHHTYDPFVLLSHVSASTSRIQLLFSLLVVPYRNPFLAASMLATLDDASAGRVVAGLGAGYLEAEFDALGARFTGRGEQIRSSAAAMRAAWSGHPVELVGDGWRASGNTLRPVPRSASGIPLWRGGNSATAIEQAARCFDAWMPFEAGGDVAEQAGTTPATLRTLARQVAVYRRTRERHRPGAESEVCFVRTNPRWTYDEQQAVDQLGALEGMGVTWVESGSAGRSILEVADDLQRLVAVATAAGMRRPSRGGDNP
jgi:probable F420-dependent oxidoreductase